MIKSDELKASVLMSVYNNEKYLKQAIESILKQSFSDFEFLIIDDGSTDNSREIIERYNDKRIKLIVNDRNLNLASSLNEGLRLAKGEYIFRMDADDISLPERLEKQISFMDKNKDIVLSGGSVKIIGSKKIWRYPLNSDICFFNLLFANSFAHPTVVLRKNFFIENNILYNINFLRCQDYELWTRVSRLGQMSNIKDIVLFYRTSELSIRNHMQTGQEYPAKIRREQLKILGVNFSDDEYLLHQKISLGVKLSIYEIFLARHWFKKIKHANRKTNIYPKSFNNFLDYKYIRIIMKNFLK